jgi:hypothetical protein
MASEYVPGDKSGKVKLPLLFDTPEWVSPVLTSVTTISAFCTVAPVLSVTVPRRVALTA